MTKEQSRTLFYLLNDILEQDANVGNPVVLQAITNAGLSIDDVNELADALADDGDFEPDEVPRLKVCFRELSDALGAED